MIDLKYKKIYDRFIEQYENIHVNPWHEISAKELEKLYNNLINNMDVNNEYNFKYFMDYIIKRLNGTADAHTMYDSWSLIPMTFRIFDVEVLIDFPQSLKNSRLISINGVKINIIIKELENVITYGTSGRRRFELERYLSNRQILFGLPSLRDFNSLSFEIENTDGNVITKVFDKDKDVIKDEQFNYNQYYYGDNATYRFIDDCLIYKHGSVQMKFKERIEQAINKLRKEDLDGVNTIIVDIRGNTGGNASLNKILMDFISEHNDKKLICLTDYRVFSGGRYALRDLIKLGATTIGEEISTPINCYGNSNWIEIDGQHFSISECYFHPFMGWSASSKEAFQKEVTSELIHPCIFTPQIIIEETKEDYIQGRDTILDYAVAYSKIKTRKHQ